MGHMFYYIDQPHTPSFPIGLVRTESDFDRLTYGDDTSDSFDKC